MGGVMSSGLLMVPAATVLWVGAGAMGRMHTMLRSTSQTASHALTKSPWHCVWNVFPTRVGMAIWSQLHEGKEGGETPRRIHAKLFHE